MHVRVGVHRADYREFVGDFCKVREQFRNDRAGVSMLLELVR